MSAAILKKIDSLQNDDSTADAFTENTVLATLAKEVDRIRSLASLEVHL